MTVETWYRGDTYSYVLTVTVDGSTIDLRTCSTIECEVNTYPGSTEDPLITLGVGTGITLRDQTVLGNVGKADMVLTVPGSVARGHVWMDVIVTFPGSVRHHVVVPTCYDVRDPVNTPPSL